MKLYFNIFLLAALMVTACQESKMTYKVKFFYFFSSPRDDKSPGTPEVVSFHFYRLDYNDPKDTAHYDAKILLITIPDTDSVSL